MENSLKSFNKADKDLLKSIERVIKDGVLSKSPRTKWKDGEPANYKSVKGEFYRYNLEAGEYPINTLRKTALKGAFHDIEAIYIKQTNIIEEMHPSIHSWWEDFVVKTFSPKELSDKWVEWAYHCGDESKYGDKKPIDFQERSIGKTYGHTVKRYDLMNKLLRGMETNPESRRHIINLWQEQQMIDDPKALVPCAFLTNWGVDLGEDENRVTLQLTQRSQDKLMTSSINPIEYIFLGLMVCNHLTFKTGKVHKLVDFMHSVFDVHIYDRHFLMAEYLLTKEGNGKNPRVFLNCPPKDFYEHTWEDFSFEGLEDIEPLPFKLELAI